jgi:hypothetical protein
MLGLLYYMKQKKGANCSLYIINGLRGLFHVHGCHDHLRDLLHVLRVLGHGHYRHAIRARGRRGCRYHNVRALLLCNAPGDSALHKLFFAEQNKYMALSHSS